MTTSSGALDFETIGPDDGTPLVLLHAFPLDRELWRPVAVSLAISGPGRVRCILVDLPGLGGSALPDGEPDLSVSVAGVVGVLDALGLERAVVAGVSMGGYVTLALLRDHPERASGVGLIDTRAEADRAENRANRIRMAEAVLGDAGRRALAPLADTLIGETSRSTRPEVVRTLAEWLERASLPGVAWSQRAMAARPDTSAALAAIRVPVAIAVGEEDGITPPESAEAMSRLAADATLTVLPASGHLSPLEVPDAVTDVLRGLLQRVG